MDSYTKIFRVLSVILGTLVVLLVVMLIVLFVRTDRNLNTEDGEDTAQEQTTLAETLSNTETEETTQEEAETEPETEEESEEESEEETVHTYKITIADCSWTQACEACLEDGGYLLNINSEEEFEEITDLIESAGYGNMVFLLGGARQEDDESYYWVDEDGEFYGDSLNAAESWCSGLWLSGEPSFADGDIEEMVVIMFRINGQWYFNDAPDDILETVTEYAGAIAYICEYD